MYTLNAHYAYQNFKIDTTKIGQVKYILSGFIANNNYSPSWHEIVNEIDCNSGTWCC